jgi:hypothetical protein
MNLFRSEESVRMWTDFEVNAEKTIKSVRDWAAMFQGAPLFRQRLDDDFVEKSDGYGNEALSGLGEALS